MPGRLIDAMALRLEHYGLIGDCGTAALVGRDGSIDWLCLPRFDSSACFAALLGRPEHGRWLIRPVADDARSRQGYRGDTLVLETEFDSASGRVSIIDFMPLRGEAADLVRLVEGVSGRVAMRMELTIRSHYGEIIPWVRRTEDGLVAIAGPDAWRLRAPVPLRNENFATYAEFTVAKGQRLAFDLTWSPSHLPSSSRLDCERALHDTDDFWRGWSARCQYDGPWREPFIRSALTLKALTYAPTGGMVAAPTTSLPEQLGGVRNWDYRYCWLRDATFTLMALMRAGFVDEASAWREWLLRAAAGKPSQARIMYGIAGERRLPEYQLERLSGYADSRPVRIGNSAHVQFQLDVFGEVADALHQARRSGIAPDEFGWKLERALIEFLESNWQRPDCGIWEVRGPARHFTHSKVMAWVAFDRAIKSIDRYRLEGPIDRWRALRDRVHRDVCEQGFNAAIGSFVQEYGGTRLDSSLLMIPLVGFLPPEDRRVQGTVDAIQRHLMDAGFVARYRTARDLDGLPEGEATFLLCSLWLSDNLALLGRHDEARRVFERVLAVRSDVGLLSESYDVAAARLVGNYPQAFSHVGLINTVRNLAEISGPANERRES